MQEVTFQTSDGIDLNGSLIKSNKPKGITVFHGATGVPSSYYQAFAQTLSDIRSHHVLFYTYRDSELQSKSALKKSETDYYDWGVLDQTAALDFMLKTFPDLPAHTVGHSLGGFCIPMHDNADKIISHTALNSGPAYWLATPLKSIPKIIAFWYLIGPIAVTLLGYLPGFLLGMKSNMPAKAYWQWREWCTHKEFYRQGFGKTIPQTDLNRFKGKLTVHASTDDDILKPSQAKTLLEFFPAAKEPEFNIIKPDAYGLKQIGHITLFSKKCSKIWPNLI